MPAIGGILRNRVTWASGPWLETPHASAATWWNGRGADQASRRTRLYRPPAGDGWSSDRDDAFTDKTIEMTEVAQQAVVAKTARVVEEVGIRKDVSERVQTVRDTVRRDEVEIQQPDQLKATVTLPFAAMRP